MENLPNELLLDVVKLMINVDAMVCFRSTQLWKYLSFFYKIQSFIDLDYQGWNIRKNTIAIASNSCDLPYTLSKSVLFLKCKLTSNILHTKSKTLKYLTTTNGCSDGNFIGQQFPNLTFLKTCYVSALNLPHTITKVKINYLSGSQKLPQTITSLTTRTNHKFNVYDILSLPYLKRLTIESMYTTVKLSSSSITHLILGDGFSARVKKMPRNLIYLRLGARFFNCENNENIALPSSLLYLKLHKDTPQIFLIKQINTVQYLSMGIVYNKNLPPKLKHIICHRIEDDLSMTNLESLEILDIQEQILFLPKTLKRLCINNYNETNLQKLLDDISGLDLTHLRFKPMNDSKNQILANWFNTMNDDVLLSLKYLITDLINIELNKLPLNIEFLTTYAKMTCLTKTKITHLKIKTCDNFPSTLINLRMADKINHHIIFPDTIKKLDLWIEDDSLKHQLPKYLTHLRLFMTGNKKRISFDLPKSLIYLSTPIFFMTTYPKTIKLVVTSIPN